MSLVRDDERLEALDIGDAHIIQNPNFYTFSSDAVLLANFVKAKKGAVVFDLCSGSGIVGLIIALKQNVKRVHLIEAQPCMADMSERSVVINNLQDKVFVKCCLIQDYAMHFSRCCADVVVCNPPYFKQGHKKQNENAVKSIARHEVLLNLEDVVRVASELLNSKGEFYLVHQTFRLQEIFSLCTKYNLAVKSVQMVQPKPSAPAHLVLIRAVKDAALELVMKQNIVLE